MSLFLLAIAIAAPPVAENQIDCEAPADELVFAAWSAVDPSKSVSVFDAPASSDSRDAIDEAIYRCLAPDDVQKFIGSFVVTTTGKTDGSLAVNNGLVAKETVACIDRAVRTLAWPMFKEPYRVTFAVDPNKLIASYLACE